MPVPTTTKPLNDPGVAAEIRLIAAPPGMCALFPFSSPPAGWLKSNGAAISRTTYAALYAAIGTTFGVGDGSTTFNLPDDRGEFLRCLDDGRGVDSGRALGSAQADDFKSHTHPIIYPGNLKPASLDIGGTNYALQWMSNGNSIGLIAAATGSTETRPRNRAYLACIKY